MHFDIEGWLMDLFDDKIHIKSAEVVCDENNNLLSALVVDELGNRVRLSSRNLKVFISLMADKENLPFKSFLQLNMHPVVNFVRIKEVDTIKKMSLVICNSFDNIYKMIIIDSKGIKREITNKKEQERLIEIFAQQYIVSVSELEKVKLDALEITKVGRIIERVDIYADEWEINDGPSVKKIIVVTNDGKKNEYSDIEDIRRIFIDLCRQEYPVFADSNIYVKKLNLAYRSDFLKCIDNISLIRVIKPIYERLEIIERSFDYRLLPTKVRVVTSNHGEQVYDLVNGIVLSDTIYDSSIGKDNQFKSRTNLSKKKKSPENGSVYGLDKYAYLLYKFIKPGEYELEKSFFIEYFAKQLLKEEGITIDKFGQDNFLVYLRKKQKEIASNPSLVVSKVDYLYFEILECTNDNYGREIISKINVMTNNGSFIIIGYRNCNEFIKKFARMKNCNVNDLLNNTQYVLDLREEKKHDVSNKVSKKLEKKHSQSFKLRDFFMNNVLCVLNKFKLSNFHFGKLLQKKVRK